MTRKKVVKLLTAASGDGQSRLANDLVRMYRKANPEAKNIEILVTIFLRMCNMAAEEGRYIDIIRMGCMVDKLSEVIRRKE